MCLSVGVVPQVYLIELPVLLLLLRLCFGNNHSHVIFVY